MKKSINYFAILMTSLGLSGLAFSANTQASASSTAPTKSSAKNSFVNEEEKLSYTIGVDLGMNFKQQEIHIVPEILFQGLSDSIYGKELKLTKEEMTESLKKFQEKMIEKRKAEFQKKSSENKAAGEQFLKSNQQKPDIKTTKSGLQYKVITEGKGKSPTDKDYVEVEYTGKLINGTVFDSSENLGKPVTFKVSEVISGWSEALKMMKEGSIWEIYIPSKLAYGERGAGGLIGPNETLIFNVKLISLKKSDKSNS